MWSHLVSALPGLEAATRAAQAQLHQFVSWLEEYEVEASREERVFSVWMTSLLNTPLRYGLHPVDHLDPNNLLLGFVICIVLDWGDQQPCLRFSSPAKVMHVMSTLKLGDTAACLCY